MNRFLLLAAPAFIGLTACSDEMVLLQKPEARTVTVTGEATATAVPDVALLDFSVTTQAKTSGEAFSQASVKMNEVISALKQQGVEPRDLQTEQVGLNPVYGQNDKGYQDRNRIVGYNAYQSLRVRLREIDAAGTVIDAAVKAGANGLNGFRMAIDDAEALQDEARVAAVKNAVAKADAMAKAAGAKLGPVISLSARGNGRPPAVMRSAAMAMDEAIEAAPKLEAGEQTVTMTINATFKLQ